MKTVTRESLMDVENYKEIFDIEFDHDHEVIMDENGTIRWKGDPNIQRMIPGPVNLNDLWYIMFHTMGMTKNSEQVRKLYRDMGYSLSGYWEIFFWKMNNEKAPEYRKSQLRKKKTVSRKATSGSAA
jgi:hypothetical protein